MNQHTGASDFVAAYAAPILKRPEDQSKRVHPHSGYFAGTNAFGDTRLRAALPVTWYFQKLWQGLFLDHCSYQDLIDFTALSERAFVAQDRIYDVTRAQIDQLFASFTELLFDPDLHHSHPSVEARAINVLTTFGYETPEKFTLDWFVQGCDELLQVLHRDLSEQSLARDQKLASLHRQRFSQLLGQFLSDQAKQIVTHGLDSSDSAEESNVRNLERQLAAFAVDPLQTLWPTPVNGTLIQTGWDGLVEDMTSKVAKAQA